MPERQQDRLPSPDGRSGWYAFRAEGDQPEHDDDAWDGPPEDSLIRFMSEDTVDIPLWGEHGLIFGDDRELIREWGVTQELADDIVQWARASQGPPSPELDADAAALIRRLRREVNYRFRIVYQP